MPDNVTIQEYEPKITETKLWNLHNLFLAFWIGVGLIIIALVIIMILKFNIIGSLIVLLIITLIYASILFFLLEPGVLRQVEKTTLRTIERPVLKEVPVEREVIKEVPVDREVIKEVYIPTKETRARLDIPKYEFLGSTETQTYHQRNCRLGKLIKKKYKLSNNPESFFKRKGFKPCKVCITKEKKV